MTAPTRWDSAQASEVDPARRELLQGLAGSALGAALLSPALALSPAVARSRAGDPGAPAAGKGEGASSRATEAAGPQRAAFARFALADVRLLDGPFKSAQQRDARYLLSLNPDRLLHNFHVNAGLTPRAPVYGGWESQEPWVDIRCHGHTLGHYLSACSQMFAATGDTAFQNRVDYLVAELHRCQQARGDGLICAFPDGALQLENSLSGREFIGVPWYAQHKVFAGLRDAHLNAGSAEALAVLRGLAEWTFNATKNVSDDLLQRMLDREHGGMNEVLADVAALGNGDTRYLQLAQRFSHRALLEPLTRFEDRLDGLHANTQIPKVIGFARLFELTGETRYADAANFFWNTVVEHRTFVTGGHGDVEHFFPPAQFADHLPSAKTMETCCTHSMLRLTTLLFTQSASVARADFYERALFNGILASQDPDSGMMTYFQATRPGYVKLYCTPEDSFWCCTGSGMENHAKYGDSLYFHDAESLYVNQFIASTVDWKAKSLRLTQVTRFPDEAATRLELRTAGPTSFTLRIRHPAWCKLVTIRLNRRALLKSRQPGAFIDIERVWQNGDTLDVELPMQLERVPLPHSTDLHAIVYGPIVLAGRLGREGLTPGADQIVNERTSGEMLNAPMNVPRLNVAQANLAQHVKRMDSAALAFSVRAAAPDRDIELVPYYRIAHERYTLYWSTDPSKAFVTSPDGRVELEFRLNDQGQPGYSVALEGRQILLPSRLGVMREDADFTRDLRLVRELPVERVADSYELRTNKRRLARYNAHRRIVELKHRDGELLRIVFQASNDGVAFRYEFPRQSAALHRIREEVSSFNFAPGTQAWLQPMSAAKTGWKGVNPAYEELYEKEIPAGTPPSTGAGWAFPALFRSGDLWAVVSEGSLPRNYCGSRLRSTWGSTEYTIAFPQSLETIHNGPVNPESALPWITPWRFVVVGSLKTIVESTLGTDLAEPPAPGARVPNAGPGKASWSWPLLGDDNTTYDVQKRFIDYAADMRWQYTLIDALWDVQIGYDKLKALVDYAASRGVKVLVWYNSAGDWNAAPQTPRDKLLTHESRVREFDRLEAIGVAGLKVDFFGGDGQSVIAYYHDILQDSAPYGFVMNFHGATLPRGWHRTYPHLMTTEAVRGLEFVTFEQKNAEDEPSHVAMLPFTRNLFDPMDFTPMVLDRIPRIERRTTCAFELALSVLFTSGIQHYAEIPEGMAKAPEFAREFLRRVPSVWADVRFIAGFPGKNAVIARYGEGRWYVAGINAENAPFQIDVSFAELNVRGTGMLMTDAESAAISAAPSPTLPLEQRPIRLTAAKTLALTIRPRGGFVLLFD